MFSLYLKFRNLSVNSIYWIIFVYIILINIRNFVIYKLYYFRVEISYLLIIITADIIIVIVVMNVTIVAIRIRRILVFILVIFLLWLDRYYE